MNVSEEMMKAHQYTVHTDLNEAVLARTFGNAESLFSFETLQFEDYSKVVFSYFDPEARKERRKTVFPPGSKKGVRSGNPVRERELNRPP